jgi:hypothetical protein
VGILSRFKRSRGVGLHLLMQFADLGLLVRRKSRHIGNLLLQWRGRRL